MKLKPTLAASLFAIIAALSLNAGAATETPTDTTAEKAAAAKTPPKKVKRHSHVEEKTGIAQTAPEAAADKADASKDKTKHYHPRDGK